MCYLLCLIIIELVVREAFKIGSRTFESIFSISVVTVTLVALKRATRRLWVPPAERAGLVPFEGVELPSRNVLATAWAVPCLNADGAGVSVFHVTGS
jgi:hypothetical protein